MKNTDQDAVEFQRKYRPTDYSEMEGQTRAVATLINMKRVFPHALALTGGAGTGKTTLARIIRKKLHCADRDYKEVNLADSRGIDTIREIISQMSLAPTDAGGLTRVWTLDEAHQLPSMSQNCFLKSLEEPPAHVYFILVTTDWSKMLRTVQTRCTKIELKPLSREALWSLMTKVSTQEKATVSEEVLHAIIDSSDGSARMALNLLQKVLALPKDSDRLLELEQGTKERGAHDLARMLIFDKQLAWPKVAKLLIELEEVNPESIRHTVLSYASSVLLTKQGKVANRAYEVIHSFECPFGEDRVVARASLLKAGYRLAT